MQQQSPRIVSVSPVTLASQCNRAQEKEKDIKKSGGHSTPKIVCARKKKTKAATTPIVKQLFLIQIPPNFSPNKKSMGN